MDGDLLVAAAAAERRPCLLRVGGGLGGGVVGVGEADEQFQPEVEGRGGGPVVDSDRRGRGADGGVGAEEAEQVVDEGGDAAGYRGHRISHASSMTAPGNAAGSYGSPHDHHQPPTSSTACGPGRSIPRISGVEKALML